jgi:hypothetical protein
MQSLLCGVLGATHLQKATSDERNGQCNFGSKSSAYWEVTTVNLNIEAVSMVGRRRFYTCKRQEGVGR